MMKLIKVQFLFLVTGISASCKCQVRASSTRECQAICDNSSHCEAWELEPSGDGNLCHLKHRTGWTAKDKRGYSAGFKHQNVVIPDTQLDGGDFMC